MATLTHHQENIACFEHFDLLTVGPVAKPATFAPRNTQPKPNAPKVRTALDESRTLFEEELAGWIEMHIMSPFQQQFLHANMSEDHCISEKVRTMDDLSLVHTQQEDNGKPLCPKQMWRLPRSSLNKAKHNSERPSNPSMHLLGRLRTF